MNLQEFKDTLSNEAPPAGLSLALKALWQEAQDDWDGAHDTLQADNSQDGSWVHAYLHRKEGDIPNVKYWYARAGRTITDLSLEAEWEEIAQALLAR